MVPYDEKLGGLTVQRGQKVRASATYNHGKLEQAVNTLRELKGYDLTNPDDLEKNRQLTGDNPNKPVDELKERQRWRSQTGEDDLALCVDKHYAQIASEVDENNRLDLSLKYCPTRGSPNKGYEAVRATVTDTNKTLARIAQEPHSFILDAIQEESPYMQRCIALHQNEFLDITKRHAVRNAIQSLNNYGTEQFLAETHKILASMYKEIGQKRDKLNEQIEQFKSANKNRTLSAVEEAQATVGAREEYRRLLEEYRDVTKLSPLIDETLLYAVGPNSSGLVGPVLRDYYEVQKLERENSARANPGNLGSSASTSSSPSPKAKGKTKKASASSAPAKPKASENPKPASRPGPAPRANSAPATTAPANPSQAPTSSPKTNPSKKAPVRTKKVPAATAPTNPAPAENPTTVEPTQAETTQASTPTNSTPEESNPTQQAPEANPVPEQANPAP